MTNYAETPADPKPKGFPFITVLATLITLFAFLGFTVLAYRSPNYLGETKSEPKLDPATRLEEVREKNRAVLDGKPESGGKMSVSEATDRLLFKLKSEKDKLPFPTPEPPVVPVPETKAKK
ncbi:MAG TPA: hypothetical protein VG097_07935 [Gemmata sp.]|nr:hypothetical protein [Gemmata sp.]